MSQTKSSPLISRLATFASLPHLPFSHRQELGELSHIQLRRYVVALPRSAANLTLSFQAMALDENGFSSSFQLNRPDHGFRRLLVDQASIHVLLRLRADDVDRQKSSMKIE